jgi:hemoglobin-like flavoprotein
MKDLTHKEQFLRSLNRCTEQPGFIPAFYERFLSTSDDIRERFRHTDFEQQHKMLLRSLQLAAGATVGEPASLRELGERAATHDRRHLNVTPGLYDIWLDTVIATARDFDDHWDASVEDAWRSILGYVISYMIKRY